MNNTNVETRNSFATLLIGTTLAIALGLAFATSAFAMGGGGGGGSAPVTPKVTEAKDPGDERGPIPATSESKSKEPEEKSLAIDDPDADKTPNKPDERTTKFPGPKVPGVVDAVVGFTALVVRIEEGKAGKLRIALSKPLPEAITLSLRVGSGSTANASGDFHLPPEVTFPKGSTAEDVVVSILEDATSESDETIVLTLEGNLPDGVTFGRKSHILTIPANDQVEEIPEVVVKPDDDVDDEIVEATVEFGKRARQMHEGEDTFLRVVTSRVLSEDVTLTLSEDSGGNNIDFSLSTVVLRSGETNVVVGITAVEDSDADDESVLLSLRSVGVLPVGVKFGIDTHAITIIDDDVVDEVEVVEAAVGFATASTRMEEGETVPVQVVLSKPFPQSVTLALSE